MDCPVQLCSYPHQHSRSNVLSPPWTSPQGKPLIHTDRIHFLNVHGWRRPIMCLCVRVGVRRQMFPSKVWGRRCSRGAYPVSESVFPFSHIFPLKPISKKPLSHWAFQELNEDKEAQGEFPQHYGLLLWIFFILMHREGLQDLGDFFVGWLMGRAAVRSRSNDKTFPVLNYEKLCL